MAARDKYDDLAKGPGKFEAQPAYAAYFYDRAMEGAESDTQYDPEDDTPIEIFEVNEEDRTVFAELAHTAEVWLWEDEQGFVCTRTFEIGEPILMG